MTPISQKKAVEKKLRPFLENPINFPEKILDQMDIFFEAMRGILTHAEQIYPFVKKKIFDVSTFESLIEKLEQLQKKCDHLQQLNEDSTNFFQVITQLVENPFKKLKKNPYLAKLKPYLWAGNTRLTEDKFKSKKFYELSYEPLNQLITKLEPLKLFLQIQPSKNLNHHHPFTMKVLTFIQAIPESMEDCLSEIISGVMYFELPPSVVLYNSQFQEYSVIDNVFKFSDPNDKIYGYLQKVISEYSLILRKYRSREKKIKIVGLWKEKKGYTDFLKLMKRLKSFQEKFEKIGFFNDD